MSPHFRFRVLPRALWAGGAAVVLVVAVIVAARAFTHDAASPAASTPQTTAPATTSKAARTPRSVPVPAAESRVVLRFVRTAVMRAHATRAELLEGWKLTGPKLRRGTSLKEWLTGTSSVTPFPEGAIAPKLQVDHSYANDSLLELALYPKTKGVVPAGVFLIGLHRYGTGAQARWLVDYWAPHGSSSMPAASG
jgi:hypothetical protein